MPENTTPGTQPKVPTREYIIARGDPTNRTEHGFALAPFSRSRRRGRRDDENMRDPEAHGEEVCGAFKQRPSKTGYRWTTAAALEWHSNEPQEAR